MLEIVDLALDRVGYAGDFACVEIEVCVGGETADDVQENFASIGGGSSRWICVLEKEESDGRGLN